MTYHSVWPFQRFTVHSSPSGQLAKGLVLTSIWSGQVYSVRTRMLYPRAAWGHALPGAMRYLLRPILGQYDASQRPDDRVSHECHSAHCVVHQWCWLSDSVRLSAESHTLRR